MGPETAEPPAQLRETHSSVVVFIGDRAYKLRKPVVFEFLDFRERPARETASYREVELNRRLSPDVYLGVADVTGPDGKICDHLVVMRRMPEDRRLSTLVRGGSADEADVRQVARLIARFHATATTDTRIAAEGTRDALRERWARNLRQTAPFRSRFLDGAVHDEITQLVQRYLDGRGPLFADRVAAGLIRDGHGDLTAEDVFCLADGPRVLDCLDFDDKLRWVDVCDDVAFLAMDLERLGARELAGCFLAAYADFSGHPRVPTLEHHYVAYRAFVRVLVSCLRGDQGDPEAGAEARDYADLALRHLRAAEPRLLLVGGAPGTGKSTLSRALAEHLGWVLVRTDSVRTELDLAGHGDRYGADTVADVYAALLARARTALEHGQCVVADATWRSGTERDRALYVGTATSSRLLALECRAPIELAAARAERRVKAGGDLSEAGRQIAVQLADDFDPWPEAVPIDTAGSLDDSVSEALRQLRA